MNKLGVINIGIVIFVFLIASQVKAVNNPKEIPVELTLSTDNIQSFEKVLSTNDLAAKNVVLLLKDGESFKLTSPIHIEGRFEIRDDGHRKPGQNIDIQADIFAKNGVKIHAPHAKLRIGNHPDQTVR